VVSDKPQPAQQTPAGLIVKTAPVPTLSQPSGLSKGERVVRTVHLGIIPSVPKPSGPIQQVQPATSEGGLPEGYAAPEVDVDLSFVRKPDGHLRALLTVQGGTVVKAVDVPEESSPVVAPAPVSAPERGWSVGAFYNPSSRGWGPVVTKDLGPFRVGAEVRVEKIKALGQSIQNNSVDLTLAIHF
jgi:hypothetical protein